MAKVSNNKQLYCSRCNRVLNEVNFYVSNNKEKYPEGRVNMCKSCFTAHVDNWDPETYVPLLEEIDVPYVPDEWNKLLQLYAKDENLNGTTILGRYLAKMKLAQWKQWRFKDTEYLKQQQQKKIEQAMRQQGFEQQQIMEQIEKAFVSAPEKPPEAINHSQPEPVDLFKPPDLEIDLTDEDVKMLSIKWGNNYKPYEWVQLEKLYSEMMESYDIHTAGHKDTLKLVCKTSLKANQLLDMNDIEGYQKLSKAYNDLMKSGHFTATQNKEEEGEYINSISELVLICEREGFIPRFYTDGPQDKADKVLLDYKRYVDSLVQNESNLSQLIEKATNQIEKEKIAIAEAAEHASEEDEDEALFSEELPSASVKDRLDFQEFLDEEQQKDDEALQKLLEEMKE